MEVTMRKYVPYAMAAMLAMTTTLGAVKTSTAGAFPIDTVTSKTAAPQDVVEAHWNGGGAFFAGAALGLFGAALAAPYYYPGYYGYAPYWNSYSYYPGYRRYGYWGYPRYRYYGYGAYPRHHRYYRYHRHW
jgi:hypothetical protein